MLLPAGAGSTRTLCTRWLSVVRQVGSKAGGLWGFFRGRGLPRTDAAAVLGGRAAQLGARWLWRHFGLRQCWCKTFPFSYTKAEPSVPSRLVVKASRLQGLPPAQSSRSTRSAHAGREQQGSCIPSGGSRGGIDPFLSSLKTLTGTYTRHCPPSQEPALARTLLI